MFCCGGCIDKTLYGFAPFHIRDCSWKDLDRAMCCDEMSTAPQSNNGPRSTGVCSKIVSATDICVSAERDKVATRCGDLHVHWPIHVQHDHCVNLPKRKLPSLGRAQFLYILPLYNLALQVKPLSQACFLKSECSCTCEKVKTYNENESCAPWAHPSSSNFTVFCFDVRTLLCIPPNLSRIGCCSIPPLLVSCVELLSALS